MDRQSPLRRMWSEVTGMPIAVLLRKLEFSFFFLFLILAMTYLVLPLCRSDVRLWPLYTTAAFVLVYATGMYFFRFWITAHFALMLHSGIFIMFVSTVLFEVGFSGVATVMTVIGVLGVALVFILPSLGVQVIVRNRTAVQPAVPGLDAAGPIHQRPRNDNQGNFREMLADFVNNLYLYLVDDPIRHINPALANGLIYRRNPHLPNGNVIIPNEVLNNEHGIPNGHAIQMRDGPNVPVVHQRDDAD